MHQQSVELPEKIDSTYEDGVLRLEKNGSSVSKRLEHAQVDVEPSSGEVVLSTESDRQDIRSISNAFKGHIRNMVDGLQSEHEYRMKTVYAHFPMDVSVQGDEVVIDNFMGERNPRTAQILDGVSVEINGEEVVVRGPSKQKSGQTAANIEQACKKGDRDPRNFQDGVYITESP
jgi:archaeal ribosomal protein L6P|nr:MAG: archaeal ribosomal protein L6P [Candidatus Nanosalinarum sp. J07AB56]